MPAAPEAAQKLIQNFLRRLKRKYKSLGLDAKYIYVLEYGQKHNRLHAHLVMTGGITRADLEQLWGLGSVSLDALRFDFDGLATLAKYLIKGGESDVRPTWKRWSASRNLEQPTITQADGQISHRKMASLCQDGGDENYLETLVDGYEMADFSLDITQDIYGGYYLAATLKKIPTKNGPWSGCLPFC